MPVSEAKKRANLKYDSKTYKKIMIRMRIEDVGKLHEHVGKRGESLNGFVNRAVSEQIERDSMPLAKAKEVN